MSSVVLLDRLADRAKLGALLDAARGGHSAVLVISGEPGVGKTALLDYAVESAESADRLRVARVAGVESEMELPFAALQQLLSPMLELAGRLPAPQQDALDVAFGLAAGSAPDRFLVGLAALSLLSEAAAERPLLCVIDDTQWLDKASAQALGFVARRLLAEPVALLFAIRGSSADLKGFPELPLGGLTIRDARVLVDSLARGPVDARVRDRLIAETCGNPLALLELPRNLSVEQFSDGLALPGQPGLPGRIEESFRRRFQELPADTQRLVLIAAAEPTGDPVLLWRAAGLLGIGTHAQVALCDAGLMGVGDRVVFRHPLVRSAVYRAASPGARRTVHAALAEATDPLADPERRAWHRAQAALGPDEDVAAELERLAGRAKARGGYSAAAAFLHRSAELTLDPHRRADRLLVAACAKYEAGAFDVAGGLVSALQAGPLDDSQRARLDMLTAKIAFASSPGSDVPPLFLKAARELEPIDMRLARETYLEALSAAMFAGRLATGGDQVEVAEAVRALPPAPQPIRATDRLLDGLALLITDGLAVAAPALKRAIAAFRSADVRDDETLRWWQVSHTAAFMWDYESWDVLSARQIKLAHDVGALTGVPLALSTRSGVHLFTGDFSGASALVGEAQCVGEATGSNVAQYSALPLAVLEGREAEAAALADAGAREARRRGEGKRLTFVQWLTAVLYNSLGRYGEALAWAEQASGDSPGILFTNWALGELVEAAARSGEHEWAADAVRRLTERTRYAGTDWASGVEARARALVSHGNAAERLYREAIERLGRTPLKMEFARAQLLYGEWLRRERRSREAKDQLCPAYQFFDSIGAGPFAERARAELRATGEHARRRTLEAREALTDQETLIASLAGRGASNRQVAEQLFISPATVAYHLRKVFSKLGVSSRHELTAALAR